MITATLAAWIPTLTFEALPPRARSRAKLAIFDACGTALAGTHHPAVRHLRQLIVEMGSAPQARLIGDCLCLNLLDAAWLTGTMVEAYLYSDTHFPSHGHFTSDVQTLMQRIELRADAALSATQGSDYTAAPAIIQADLHDGRSLTETVEYERGSPQRPPSRQEFEAKFRRCARDVLSTEQTLLAMRYLYQLDTLPDIRCLLDALSLAPSTA